MKARPTRIRKPSRVVDRLWALTLNGHLLPGFESIAANRVLRLSLRGPNWPVWGARQITYVKRAVNIGYTVQIDRKRGLRLLGQAIRQARDLVRNYPELVAEYRGRYGDLTSEAAWTSLLDLDDRKT
jgi:hypothetical protein